MAQVELSSQEIKGVIAAFGAMAKKYGEAGGDVFKFFKQGHPEFGVPADIIAKLSAAADADATPKVTPEVPYTFLQREETQLIALGLAALCTQPVSNPFTTHLLDSMGINNREDLLRRCDALTVAMDARAKSKGA